MLVLTQMRWGRFRVREKESELGGAISAYLLLKHWPGSSLW